MERRLGRGLGSLLGAPREEATKGIPPRHGEAALSTEAGQAAQAPTVPTHLAPTRIRPNPHQPRRVFKAEHLEELGASLRQHGMLQPIVVRPQGEGFEIISGERRWRAAQAVGLAEVPVIVREATDREMLELALVENVQRQDLDALEKARGFRDLMESLGLTQEQVAIKVGLKRSTVTNHLRLLELPEAVQQGVAQGIVSMGHARALLGLGNPEEILRAFQRVVRDELSVRATEVLVRGTSEGGSTPQAKAAPGPKEPAGSERAPWARDLERRLQEGLGLRAQVLDSGDGTYRGKLVLHYHDRAELERLMQALAPREELE